MNNPGKLYVVATPIGNLEDITLRAINTLKSVDIILAEDTRVTAKLLNHYDIKKPMVSVHERSRPEKIGEVVLDIKSGKNAAFVSDAGTPAIADPGGFLVQEAIKLGIETIPIPGPSALTTAFSIAGIRSEKGLLFLGYFPKKKGRQTLLNQLKEEKRTIVFYESPYRIIKTLNNLREYLGDREVVVCRELTKKFEETYRGKISEVLPQIKPKGEFVIILSY